MTSTSTCWIDLADNQLTLDNVHHILEPIPDNLWVAAACADRLVDDVAIQRALLELGIERTHSAVEASKAIFAATPLVSEGVATEGAHGSASSTPDDNIRYSQLTTHFRDVPADAQLCRIRTVLLARLDRLNTYVEMCSEAPEDEGEDLADESDEWEDNPWVDGDAEPSSTPKNKINTFSANPPLALTAFLTDSLVRTSCLLASRQWFSALRVLFGRHNSSLWPYRCAILESIPEHVHPAKFRELLPSFDASRDTESPPVPDPWRLELDWSETPKVREAVDSTDTPSWIPSNSDDSLTRLDPHSELLTAVELTAWYTRRIDHVIASTGMIDIALATAQHGASQGIPNLDQLGEDLSLLSRLVYDAPRPSDDGNEDDDWTLNRWISMDPSAVVHAYLKHSSPETVAADITRLVMPYLFVLESRAERSGNPDFSLVIRMLHEYILSSPLDIVAAIFEASKPTLPAAERLIRNDEDIARLALACLYGSNSLSEWSTMSRIFECLPAWDATLDEEGDEDAIDSTFLSLGNLVKPSTSRPTCTASDLLAFFTPLPQSSLSRALDILDVHLESGEILSRWSVPAPLRWFLQSSGDVAEQRAWAIRMARRAGGSDDQLNTPEDWDWLLDDMLKLSGKGDSGLRGAFGLLSRLEVMSTFFAGLLSSGKFDIAKGMLHNSKSKLRLELAVIEDICISCSHEFYDNASTGNYKFGEMKLAYECLDVPPLSDRLIKEKEFIEATSRLSSFNITSRPGTLLTPIEIRLTKDRLSLVARVLSSNADAYKHVEVILDLVYKLGFRDDPVAVVKTLAMLSDTALQAEDFTRAYETSERMVDTVINLRSSAASLDEPSIQEASEVCWVACFQLGRQPEFDELDKKLLLLGRALELCPPDKLNDVLAAWRRLETEDIENRQARLASHHSGIAPRKPIAAASNGVLSLAARLQDFRMPAPPLLHTPDAAALASRTFRSVAANFPFPVGGRNHSPSSQGDSRFGGGSRADSADVSAQATRVLSKGIGWLIGDDL